MASEALLFPQFSLLAPEIRCMIWRNIIPGPRIVPVRYEKETVSYKPRILPPVILQVNRESRHEGLERYHELILGPGAVTGCYVDLSIDIVYLSSNGGISTMGPEADLLFDLWKIAERGRLISPPLRGAAAFLEASPNPQDPSDGGASEPHATSGMVSHSKVIFDDLMRSPHGQQLFKCFHIDNNSWRSFDPLYRYYRHRLPFKLKEVCIVYERWDGPLGEVLEMQSIPLHEEIPADSDVVKPAYYDEDRVAVKMARSFAAQNTWVNRKDKKKGLTPVLCSRIEAKILNRSGERLAVGVQDA
jgi:hypothetical protein